VVTPLTGRHCKFRPNTEGDVVGTGSSRKSATNSILWFFGDDIPNVPNKRTGSVCIGSKIAPIFYNTMEDSGTVSAFSDRNLHSRMPLDATHVRLKLLHACDQWHSSRKFTFLPVATVNCVANTEGALPIEMAASVAF
jgi:aconitase B